MIEPRVPPHGANRPQAAEHEGKATDIKAQHAQWVNHEVHRHRMGHVLRPGEPCLHHGKSRLHEHDEETGDQGPDDVDGDPVVPDGIGQLGQGGFAGLRRRDIDGGAGVGTTRIRTGRQRNRREA